MFTQCSGSIVGSISPKITRSTSNSLKAMTLAMISSAVLFAATCIAAIASAASAADCSAVVMEMLPCVDYITIGGTAATPSDTCCTATEDLLKTNGECVCEELKQSGGLQFNLTRAISLPAACGISSPLPDCGIPLPPGMEPALVPSSKARPPVPGAAAPTPFPGSRPPMPFPGSKAPTPFPGSRAPTPFPAGSKAPTSFPGSKAPTPFPAGSKAPTPFPVSKAPTPFPGSRAPTPFPGSRAPTQAPFSRAPGPSRKMLAPAPSMVPTLSPVDPLAPATLTPEMPPSNAPSSPPSPLGPSSDDDLPELAPSPSQSNAPFFAISYNLIVPLLLTLLASFQPL